MSDNGSTPRARPTGSELSAKREAGVAAMVKVMEAGKWKTNGHIQFAEEWGVAPGTAAHWAGEASRQLKALRAAAGIGIEERRALVVSSLERHADAAGEGTREAIAATLGIAKVEGLERTLQQAAEERAVEMVRERLEIAHAEMAPEAYAQLYEIFTRPLPLRAPRSVGMLDVWKKDDEGAERE